MRGAFLILIWAATLPAQQGQPAPDARSATEPSPAEKRAKRVAALLEEVDGLAAAEPPQLAIDSLIRSARAIRSEDRKRGLAYLESAKERLSALQSKSARASFASQLGQIWSELDPAAAEEICRSIPNTPPEEFESDPKSACWATRITRESKPAALGEASLRALADGVFSTTQHATTLSQLQKADPEAAATFLTAYLAHFPEKTAGLPELKGMVHLLRAAGAEQPALVRQVLELGIRSLERKEFPEPKRPMQFEARIDGRTIRTSGARDSLAFQLADVAWMVAPDLLESHPDTLGKWKADVSGGDWQRRRITRFRESEQGLDASLRDLFDLPNIDPTALDASNPEAAMAVLAASDSPQVKLLIQIQFLLEKRQTDEERKRTIKDVLANLGKLPARNRLRLFALFILIDNALEKEDLPSASEFAKQLVVAFDATIACPDPECEAAAAAMEAGELAADFLGYLDGKGMQPAELGIAHPSLTLRARLRELGRLLEETKPTSKPKAPSHEPNRP